MLWKVMIDFWNDGFLYNWSNLEHSIRFENFSLTFRKRTLDYQLFFMFFVQFISFQLLHKTGKRIIKSCHVT